MILALLLFTANSAHAQTATRSFSIEQTKAACEAAGTSIASHLDEKNINISWQTLNNPDAAFRKKILWDGLNEFMASTDGLGSAHYYFYTLLSGGEVTSGGAKEIETFLNKRWLTIGQSITLGMKAASTLYPTLPIKTALKISDYHFVDTHELSAAMLLEKEWVKVLTDPRFRAPLLKISLRLVENLQKGTAPKGTFDADLVQSFMDEGIPRSTAEELSWTVLGIYGSQGAFLWTMKDLLLGFGQGVDSSLAFISLALNYFDSIKPEGQLYSLPAEVTARCKIGKPYHFWMAAYLSYRLRKENYRASVSAKTSYALGTLYEFYSKTNGRNQRGYFGHDVVEDKNLYSDALNGIRVGLSLKAIGAQYGAAKADSFSPTARWDFEKVLQKGLNTSKKAAYMGLNRLTRHVNPVTRHENLKRIFSSDEIFKAAKAHH